MKTHRGFTLVEMIVAIVVGAAAGAALIQLMGTSLTRSGETVVLSQDEALVERQLEQVVGDYITAINSLDFSTNPDPQSVLSNMSASIATGTYNSGNVTVTSSFIQFVNGVETGVVGPTNTLRVRATRIAPDSGDAQFSLSTLLTVTRNDANQMGVQY